MVIELQNSMIPSNLKAKQMQYRERKIIYLLSKVDKTIEVLKNTALCTLSPFAMSVPSPFTSSIQNCMQIQQQRRVRTS